MMDTFAHIIHIITMIFFIAVVGFRTFIMPVLREHFSPEEYKKIDSITGKRARRIIQVSNLLLLLSGLYLLRHHWESLASLLGIKVTIGVTLIASFYLMPVIMQQAKKIPWMPMAIHYAFFSMMMVVVILSQIMFR